VIDIYDIGDRYQRAETFLDEWGRRRIWLAARSIVVSRILRSGQNPIGNRVRRSGGGRKSAVTHQPGLPAALEALIEDAIRGDPCSPLRWVSRSLRHLVKALSARGFQASQRVVANLLRDLKYSCQANQKTREGGNHPHQYHGQSGARRWRTGDFGRHEKEGTGWRLQERRSRTPSPGAARAGAGARLQDP
jgi:hypothetical protein